MDILMLPALPPSTSLERAWEVMEESKRSAVVVGRGASARLIPARVILRGMKRKRKRVGELQGRALSPVRSMAAHRDATAELEPIMPRIRRLGERHARLRYSHGRDAAANMLLSGSRHGIGLIRVRGGQAMVLSRRESDLEDHSGKPRRCYCKNPNYEHGFRQGRNGEPCPRACGYTLMCR